MKSCVGGTRPEVGRFHVGRMTHTIATRMDPGGNGYWIPVLSCRPSDPNDLLVIYLNDHRALLAGERSLAERSAKANVGSDLGGVLQAVVDQNDADQVAVEHLLERVGGTPNPVKKIAALIGERFGRLKMNGQLSGYSPLSRVIEIEVLLASTSVRRAMWNAVAVSALDHDVTSDAALRADAADEQHTRLREHHVDAVSASFDTAR